MVPMSNRWKNLDKFKNSVLTGDLITSVQFIFRKPQTKNELMVQLSHYKPGQTLRAPGG
jgi:hypothetical protein